MREERSDASPMDRTAGAACSAVQAQKAVNQAVQLQKAAQGAGAAQKAAHGSQAAYAVTAAGTALGGPLGTVVGTLATSRTFWKIVAGVFAALFLWMFLIANMIGIILAYLGVADADAFANEAQSAELSNIKEKEIKGYGKKDRNSQMV